MTLEVGVRLGSRGQVGATVAHVTSKENSSKLSLKKLLAKQAEKVEATVKEECLSVTEKTNLPLARVAININTAYCQDTPFHLLLVSEMTTIRTPHQDMLTSVLQRLKLPAQTYEFDKSMKGWFYGHVYFSYEHPVSKQMVNEVCIVRTDTNYDDAKEKVSQLAVDFLRANCGVEIERFDSFLLRKISAEAAEKFM
ncbi:uncharacterized protein LOC126660972 [Mercurialis annua]|uniref:uncharacterized protein LOC126660972 n=1 Tax=Mercurialis annua TaxID=3986 RepID=UPI0024AFB361|nr:uncharacterized protein LOC126660972 [Mercurialis annua]